MNRVAYLLIVWFHTSFALEVESTWEAQLALEKVTQTSRVGLCCNHAKARGTKEVLGDRTLQSRVLFFLDEGLWIQVKLFAQSSQKFRGAIEANWRLKIRHL